MAIHTLHRKQIIAATRDAAWAFFSNPRNLASITPPELGFEVLTPDLPAHIYPGMMIAYRVRPLLGVPMKWLTEITQVKEGEYFVDEQRIGPYSIWHHEHWFRPAGEGKVEIEDRVTYALPLGWLGNLAHPLLVRPQLERIFAFRQQVMNEVFPPV